MSDTIVNATDMSNENVIIDSSSQEVLSNTSVNTTDMSNENVIIDSSSQEVLLKQRQEYMNNLRQRQIENKKTEFVQVICRQTELTEEEAKYQLEECNYDCNSVLNKYFGVEPKCKKKSTNVNEIIYGEIRNLMDTGARRFRMEQEKAQYIQKMKERMEEKQKQQMMQKQKEGGQLKLEPLEEEAISDE